MELFENFILITILGYVLDLIFGDPTWLYHPVCLIGSMISYLESILLKRAKNDTAKYVRGIFLWFATVSATALIFLFILFVAKYLDTFIIREYGFNLNLHFIFSVYMSYQILASKSLGKSSREVYEALKREDIDEARHKVSMIVGRDTKNLNEDDIIKATVETVAENTSDAVIAPMFYMIIGGAVLGFVYKAVNTLDSMVGYKNEKYIFFGRFSAIMDDIFNFIPARISAFLIIASSFILGMNYKNAIKIFKRDRLKHASPNSANTESACAGALDIQLAGDAYYFGKKYEKEFIGDFVKKVQKQDIIKANKLMYASGILFGMLSACLGLLSFYLI